MNGVFTARSLARVYAALGGDDGLEAVRLWSPSTRRSATEPQDRQRDLVVPVRMRWRLGYHQPFPTRATSPSAFGFYGAYGSGGYADPDRRLAVGFVVHHANGLPLNELARQISTAIDDPRTARSGRPGFRRTARPDEPPVTATTSRDRWHPHPRNRHA